MTRYNIVHFQNPVQDKETAYADWQRRTLAPAVLALPGVTAVRYFNLQAVQLQPPNVQPWRLAAVHELETDDLAGTLAAFTAAARLGARKEGLLEADVAHVFELTRPFLHTPNEADLAAPLHVAFVMGNCIEGKEFEYDEWYDNIHSVEVLGTPDFIGMRRGVISKVQADAADAQPANRLVLLFLRSKDLWGSIEEFIDRAYGRSKSGVVWAPREAAAGFASLNRTTHVFSPYTPRLSNERDAVPAREAAAQG